MKKDILFGIQIGFFIFLLIYTALMLVSFFSSGDTIVFQKDLVEYLIIDIVVFYIKLLFVFIVSGALLGGFVGLFWHFICFHRIDRKKVFLKGFVYFVSVFLLWLLIVMRQIVFQPCFFSKFCDRKPDFLSLFHYWLTDNMPIEVFDGFFIFCLAVFIFFVIVKIYKDKHWERITKRKTGLIMLCLVILLSVFILYPRCGGNFKGTNVLIICVETLRPDHLSCNGYTRSTTPNIDKLANSGISFTNAFVNIARTSPSITSVLTGAYPKKHGIIHMFPDAFASEITCPTLPSILRQRGYAALAIGDYSGEMFSNIDYGFEKIICPEAISLNQIVKRTILLNFISFMPGFTSSLHRSFLPVLDLMEGNDVPEFLTRKIITSIENHRKRENFFMFAFYSAPHIPFNAAYPYYKFYSDPLYSGENKYSCKFDDIHKINEYMKIKTIPEKEKKQIIDLYDGTIKSVDDQIGVLASYLKKTGLMDNTIIILLSDHGENFYENGMSLGHGAWFEGYDYSNRIPLILNTPLFSGSGRINTSLVRDIDVAPTVLDLLGIDFKGKEHFDGKTLMSLINGSEIDRDTSIFCETGLWFCSEATFGDTEGSFLYPSLLQILTYEPARNNIIILKSMYNDIMRMAKHRMYRDNNWKLIFIPNKNGARYELFNIKNDPGCKKNLVSQEKEVLKRLKKKLIRHSPGYLFN